MAHKLEIAKHDTAELELLTEALELLKDIGGALDNNWAYTYAEIGPDIEAVLAAAYNKGYRLLGEE